jgi:hypothetical protein
MKSTLTSICLGVSLFAFYQHQNHNVVNSCIPITAEVTQVITRVNDLHTRLYHVAMYQREPAYHDNQTNNHILRKATESDAMRMEIALLTQSHAYTRFMQNQTFRYLGDVYAAVLGFCGFCCGQSIAREGGVKKTFRSLFEDHS